MSINLTKTPMIDITKKYRTRDGQEVIIHSTNGPRFDFPVIASLATENGWLPYQWPADGKHPHGKFTNDLIEVREPQIVRLIMPAPNNRKYQPDYIDWPASERLSIDPTLQTGGNWIVRRFIEILDEPTP